MIDGSDYGEFDDLINNVEHQRCEPIKPDDRSFSSLLVLTRGTKLQMYTKIKTKTTYTVVGK